MAFATNEEINEIRAKSDIVSVIGSYIPLTQKGGNNYFGVCPFHDDHSPSMSVSREKQIYKCFSCGASGNVFTFVQNYEGVEFIDAVSIVAEKCGLDISLDKYKSNVPKLFKEEHEIMDVSEKFFANNLRTAYGKEALEYLNNRGITEDIIKEFGIGLSLDNSDSLLKLLNKKGYTDEKLLELGLISKSDGRTYDMFTRRITFPLWDKDGKIVGFSARIYRGEKDTSKYINSRETEIFKKGKTLYNYHQAKDAARREKEVLVVEGFMDAIRVSSIGIKNVVALQGTAMTDDQINLLKKLKCRVILCLDNDDAGLLATINNGEELVKAGIETGVIRLSGEKDPDEYILANGKEAFLDNMANPLTYFEFKMNSLKSNRDLRKPEDLTLYINDVLKNLALNDDVILREATLNKLSNDYNFTIDNLKARLNQFLDIQEKTLEKVTVKEELQKDKTRKDKYMKASEGILYYMMNGGEFINEYKKKLGFFENSIYREIANEICYYYETNGDINTADFITYVSMKDTIKDKVMDIVNEIKEDELTISSLDDYISVVSKITNKNEINRLMDLMKNELDVNKKMKLAMQIAELKKEDV